MTSKSNRYLNIALWIAQFILGGMFIMAGLMKSTKPIEELAAQMPWVNDFSTFMVRLIGVSELLGGIALIIPSILRIVPKLTIYAALGIALIMILAAVYHIAKGEYSVIGINILLAGIGAFIAWGRSSKVPVHARLGQ